MVRAPSGGALIPPVTVLDDLGVSRAARGPFRVSVRVQAAGVLSLLSMLLVLALLAWALVQVSVALGVIVGFAFVVGLQVVVARRWGCSRRDRSSDARSHSCSM